MPLTSLVDGPVDRLPVAPVDPEIVRQVGRAHLDAAPPAVAVADGAVVRVDLLAGFDGTRFHIRGWRLRERLDIGDDVQDALAVDHLVAPESHHLADAGLRAAGIDADPDRLGDRLRIAAPATIGR